MAVSTHVKNFTMTAITLVDGTTPTAESLVVALAQGDLQLEGLEEVLREVSKYETRGVFNSAAYTNKKYPTGSFSVKLSQFTDATNGTFLDFLRRTGAFSSNVSTLGTGTGLPYTIDLDIDIEGTDYGDAADHGLLATDVHFNAIGFAEGDPDIINASFEVWGTITPS